MTGDRTPPGVLLVYSRVGGGHLSVARALESALQDCGPARTRMVDVYLECGRFPATIFPAAYARVARSHPLLWSLLYRASSVMAPRRAIGSLIRRGLARVVAEERPALIVSVLPVVNQVVAEAARVAGARCEVVLTDWHAIHRLWLAPGVQHYTVPTDSARADCIERGAPADRVDVLAIPVREAFAAVAAERREIVRERLAELELDPRRFTVVAMVGAEGSPRALRNLAQLIRLEIDAQVVVVCGRNEALRRQVERMPHGVPTRALGFVEDIAPLMRAADVLVTKAGGVTLAEAFCCGVAVVIHDVLPGQEAGNLAYILAQGAVEYAATPDELARTIIELAGDAARRDALAQRGSRLARPDAAREIARRLLERVGSSGAAGA